MSRQQIRHLICPQLCRSPVNYLIGGGEQMQTTNYAIDGSVGKMLLRKRQRFRKVSWERREVFEKEGNCWQVWG